MTLTTGIPEERCRRVNLGHTDYRTIDTEEWAGRQEEGVLLAPHAGGVLCRNNPLLRSRNRLERRRTATNGNGVECLRHRLAAYTQNNLTE
jgi:hypothetical protein